MIAGVLGGVAETFNLDSSLLRLGAVFLCLITGIVPLLVTYLVAWIIIPLKFPGDL